MRANDYDPGNWKAICDVCGFQFMADELVLGTAPGQQGLRVCRRDLDKRNPQDFVRPIMEKITPPWTRPDTDDDNVAVPVFWVNNLGWNIPWTNNLSVTIPWTF